MKPGDIVRLKSGGPLMTVSIVTKHADDPNRVVVICQWFEWFDGRWGTSLAGHFEQACLVKIEEPQ